MLFLNREFQEEIDIIAKCPFTGDHIIIKVDDIIEYNNKIKVAIGIEAPKRYKIHRREITNKLGGKDYIKSVNDSYFENGDGI